MRLSTLIGPDLKEVLREDPEQVRELFSELHPEDVADILGELEPDEAATFLSKLPAEEAAPIFERLEEHEQEEIVEVMPPESVVQIASEMEPDDRADLFSALPEAVGDALLERLERVDPEAAEEVRELEKWPETSAGHLMTTAYVHLPQILAVRDAIEAVRTFDKESDAPIYNVYVLEREKLLGIVPLRELVLRDPSTKLSDIMREPVITVHPTMDQEEVAKQMAKYDLNVVPVVDDKHVLLGVITIDDIVDVLTQEQTEDVQKLGGVQPLEEGYFQTTFWSFIRKRGVVLVILFIEEFFTQTAMRHYDWVLDAIKGAAYYVPLLISTGGNSGGQSSTLIIRGLATGEIRPRDWWRILFRELGMGLALGSGLGFIGMLRVKMYPDQSWTFAFTVAATLVGIVVMGCTVGSMMPLLLKRIGIDPATSSAPFIASLVDVLGIIIFVHVAKILMSHVIAAAAIPH